MLDPTLAAALQATGSMGEHIPRRKASNASSSSSGTTIKASSRQASGSNGGFFARFRSSSQSRSQDGDSDDGETHDETMVDPEAGPSDYYMRSPSPSSSPKGWGSPSAQHEEEEGLSGPPDRQGWAEGSGHEDVWANSGERIPDADDSMDMDMLEYQKRIQAVLTGGQERAGTGDAESIGAVDAGSDRVDGIGSDGVLEKTGIGEEEFGAASPRSSPPSTPLQNQRQLSYIRECDTVSTS
jgi:hypothetical protein